MKFNHPTSDPAHDEYFSGNNSDQEDQSENEDDQKRGDDEAEEVKEKKVVKVRNVVRKPMPKLDANRYLIVLLTISLFKGFDFVFCKNNY
jgi:hypothetical protein